MLPLPQKIFRTIAKMFNIYLFKCKCCFLSVDCIGYLTNYYKFYKYGNEVYSQLSQFYDKIMMLICIIQ